MSDNILVVVTGPTASGKTSLAIDLASRYGTEIISADSRQIYKDIPIGTAAPTEEERGRAFHHLVGILDLDDYYSAARFEADAMRLLPSIWAKSNVAVVSGGSMMYVDALTKGIDDMPTIDDATRQYVLNLLNQHGLEGVLAQLHIVDPQYYSIVDRCNTRRVVHALEVSLQAGKPYSTFRTGQAQKRPFTIIKIAIEWQREKLFERINTRVAVMIEAGLEAEARAAFAKGNFNSLNTVGYKELAAYFRGEMDRETAIARIAKNTRVYAKKQLTWLKRDPDIIWLNPDNAFEQACAIIDNALLHK
ncbi:MAG: tRNA (adenosine(37)-N6)-dimethylallyltransferase MiaA [Muribaculaceae bacterium]|nr:tRNA (adenosine(37)-N6)-dimethylallyltransferase MiaA [Muribaculaceae bacterium]